MSSAAIVTGALTLCMLGNFCMLFCRLWIFFKLIFPKKIFQKYYQSVKQFASKSGQGLIRLFVEFFLVQTVCKGYQQMTKVATSGESVKA